MVSGVQPPHRWAWARWSLLACRTRVGLGPHITTKLNKRTAGSVSGVLALGGGGTGVANAATSPPAPSTGITDTATSGDDPDAPGSTSGGTTQQGDQGAPDGSGAEGSPDTPGV